MLGKGKEEMEEEMVIVSPKCECLPDSETNGQLCDMCAEVYAHQTSMVLYEEHWPIQTDYREEALLKKIAFLENRVAEQERRFHDQEARHRKDLDDGTKYLDSLQKGWTAAIESREALSIKWKDMYMELQELSKK
jgi:hypothetical protein